MMRIAAWMRRSFNYLEKGVSSDPVDLTGAEESEDEYDIVENDSDTNDDNW